MKHKRGARDSHDHYGLVSIALHWLVALSVVALIVLGLLMEWTITFDDQSLYGTLKNLHISTGVLLCVVLLPRIAWRMVSGWRETTRHRHAVLRRAARIVPITLLVLVSIQAVTGIVSRWADRDWSSGEADTLPFFGLFEIPGPLSQPLPSWNAPLEWIHDLLAEPIMILLAVHVLGAIWREAEKWREKRARGKTAIRT